MWFTKSFLKDPSGRTPLISTLKRIYSDKNNLPDDKQLLIIVVTDGEPSDGNLYDLRNVLMRKKSNVHISFAECTDNARKYAFS